MSSRCLEPRWFVRDPSSLARDNVSARKDSLGSGRLLPGGGGGVGKLNGGGGLNFFPRKEGG